MSSMILITRGAGFVGSHLAASVGVGRSMYDIGFLGALLVQLAAGAGAGGRCRNMR